jgi:hypothetical protein
MLNQRGPDVSAKRAALPSSHNLLGSVTFPNRLGHRKASPIGPVTSRRCLLRSIETVTEPRRQLMQLQRLVERF